MLVLIITAAKVDVLHYYCCVAAKVDVLCRLLFYVCGWIDFVDFTLETVCVQEDPNI